MRWHVFKRLQTSVMSASGFRIYGRQLRRRRFFAVKFLSYFVTFVENGVGPLDFQQSLLLGAQGLVRSNQDTTRAAGDEEESASFTLRQEPKGFWSRCIASNLVQS